MSDFLVRLAYRIEGSRTHHKFRAFLTDILENHNSKNKKIFDAFMIFLVISTIGILIYEVKHHIPIEIIYYEYCAVFIFILEWLARYAISFESHKQIIRDFEESQYLNIDYKISESIKIIIKRKVSYIISPSSIIDLLAILPSYRPLRILRVFLLLRLFKVLQYSNSINQFLRIFVEKKLELTILLVLYIAIVMFSATVIYVYEGGGSNGHMHTYWDAVYWSFVTVATIGYGDIVPHSDAGRIVVFILIIAGLASAAFFTAIVTSAMGEKLNYIKKNKTISNAISLQKYILVCGYGRTCRVLVDNLKKNNHDVVIIEQNPEICTVAEDKGYHVIKDDPSNIDLLQNIGIMNKISSVVILSNDDTVNLSIILSIRSINPNVEIISRCNSSKSKNKLKIAGATDIIQLNDSASLVAMGYLKSPIAYEAIDDMLTDFRGASITELEIFKNSPFIGKPLSEIMFNKFNITFVGISHNDDRNNLKFNPDRADTIIEEKDFLIVIGYEKTIKSFKSYLQSPTKFEDK
ncbi:MAG: potassium channel family protein [Arcobacteraceae bacterium]